MIEPTESKKKRIKGEKHININTANKIEKECHSSNSERSLKKKVETQKPLQTLLLALQVKPEGHARERDSIKAD